MPTVTTEYCGVEGTGGSLKEAKADAARKIERSLKGSYTPEIVAHRGWAHLIYREPDGWHYRNIATPQGVRDGQVWGSRGGTYEETLRAVQSDLALLGWAHEDALTPPALLEERSQIADFQSWARFQLRYRAARILDLPDHACHEAACGFGISQELDNQLTAAVAAAVALASIRASQAQAAAVPA